MKRAVLISFVFCMLAIARPAMADDSIVTEGIIDAPVSAVWDAWATTAGLKAWLAPHVDIELRIDGLMRANYDPEGSLGDRNTIENRVLAYDPQRMLAIKVVRAPEDFPFKGRVGSMWTVMYFQPAADGRTALRIVGMGFGSDDESRRMKQFFEQGNAHTLAQLQKHFHP